MVQAAKLSINTGATALQMADAMFGAGVTVVSATYRGDGLSSGIFSGGLTTSPGAVPADSGVILSTGRATDFTNSTGSANLKQNTGTNTAGIDNDSLLNGVAGVRTYDAAILEANFIPTGDTLTMQLVFSSEEYLEWVHAGYNDAVGIWVNGTKAQLAIGDGDISIDNINTTSNQNLFINNTTSVVNTEMDGLTVTLTVKAPVIAGEVNTIRFGIADAGDAIYDSNLLIIGDSVQTQLIAEDDSIGVTAKGETTVNLLANDTKPTGTTIDITHINGKAVTVGQSIALTTGEVLTVGSNGTITVQATKTTQSTVFTYAVSDGQGGSDTAYATINTSPVDGTSGNDMMGTGFADGQNNQVEGTDGASEVIMGYGGNDKIVAGAGNDDIYGGDGNDFIRAGTGNDLLFGNNGDDVLDGGEGADAMTGGNGNDVYYIDNVGDSLTETANNGIDRVISSISYVLGSNVEHLWLREGSTALNGTGNDLDNILIGNSLGNTLLAGGGTNRVLGMAGDDTLTGGSGRDTLDGGNGDDALTGAGDNDKLAGGNGADTLDGGAGNDTLRGGSGTDTLTGGDGNDVLAGGADADTMAGGSGNDVYVVDDSNDSITELSGAGTDEVLAYVSWALSDEIENLRLRGSAETGMGNGLDNRMFGTANANTLTGFGGNDDLRGFGGNDILEGGAGRDRLIGGNGADQLLGGGGNDRIKSGSGGDLIDGGAGNDMIFTGGGADIIQFATGSGADVIRDFNLDNDTLAFDGLSLSDLSIAKRGSGVLISYGDGDSLYLSGVGPLSLGDLNIDFF